MVLGGICTALQYVDAFAIAPFVASNGTWNDPLPKTVSPSTLQYGVDFQAGINTSSTIGSFFYASPYYQTDYQEKARLQGVVLGWEPIVKYLALGEKNDATTNNIYTFFWQARPEVDLVQVYSPGTTNFKTGYNTIAGATAQVNIGLFPISEYSERGWFGYWIAGRISLIGTVSDFRDSNTHTNADYYTAKVSYKLGQCLRDTSTHSNNPKILAEREGKPVAAANQALCQIQGSSAVSLGYDWGTNKDTWVYVKKWLLSLSYAY
jgi:hypothetical protein